MNSLIAILPIVIIGVIILATIIILAAIIFPDLVRIAHRRRRDQEQAKREAAEQAKECHHSWSPWSDPSRGTQVRSCLICNIHQTEDLQ